MTQEPDMRTDDNCHHDREVLYHALPSISVQLHPNSSQGTGDSSSQLREEQLFVLPKNCCSSRETLVPILGTHISYPASAQLLHFRLKYAFTRINTQCTLHVQFRPQDKLGNVFSEQKDYFTGRGKYWARENSHPLCTRVSCLCQ